MILNESDKCLVSRVFKSHHAGSLHSLAQTGSVGFTPEHVAGEISGTLCHDESKGVDILSHTHKGQEAHPALWQHFLILGLKMYQTQTTDGRINILNMMAKFSQCDICHLFSRYCEGSWCNIDRNWNPVVFNSAAHCCLQGFIYHIHTCKNTRLMHKGYCRKAWRWVWRDVSLPTGFETTSLPR